jgi:hypothetical protein
MHLRDTAPERIRGKKEGTALTRFWRALSVLTTLLALSAPLAAGESAWRGVERIVAVGDIHGDYDTYVTLLQSARIINKKLNWDAGRTHLVQLGDVPDRGSAPRKIMDLLMKLERQAEKAKGKVHVLIGNHDAMNVYGDLRYVTPQEFAEFSTGQSADVRQSFIQQEIEEQKKRAEAAGGSFQVDDAWRSKWESEHPLGWFEHRFAYGPKGKYGQWIRSHNAVIQIDDTLFVHAGIGPKYVGMSAEEINTKIRQELEGASPLEGGVAADNDGPLWYRGFAQDDEQELSGHVSAVLNHFGVKRIVIGHTPTLTTVIPRFSGAVILADVGLSKSYGGPPACLTIERGKPYTLHRGKQLEIPADSGKGLLDYLKAAASLDPKPSPIEKMIAPLEQKLNGTEIQKPTEEAQRTRRKVPAPPLNKVSSGRAGGFWARAPSKA